MSQAVIDTPTTAAPTTATQLDLPWSEQDHALFSRASETAREANVTPRRQTAAPSERRPVVRALLTYPTVFVSVPRAVAAHYGQQPWDDVLRAAERGIDGLAVVTERPLVWRGRPCDGSPQVPDVAFLAEGQDEWRGRTVLYQQNW
jgi:hypothetical protein